MARRPTGQWVVSRAVAQAIAVLVCTAAALLGAPGAAHAATVPGAPTAVGPVAQGNLQAFVQWSAPSSDGGSPITGYTVTASPGGATCSTGAGQGSCTVTVASAGRYTFTVAATNASGPSAPSAPSPAIDVTASLQKPFGSLDVVSAGPDSLAIGGWAIDPDTSLPVPVSITLDGIGHILTADQSRPDVGQAFPSSGSNHGFSAYPAVQGGSHQVCASALDTGGVAQGTVSLGCRTVVVGGDPFGALDVVTAVGPGTVRVAGWALDPDANGPSTVAVYVGAQGAWFPTTVARPDVNAAFPLWVGPRGFDLHLPASAGAHDVCAYAINEGSGTTNTLLGCRRVQVGGDPIGALDSVLVGNGGFVASGWAIDPDTASSIPVALYVDGRGLGWLPASTSRPDVGQAFPAYGSAHGFAFPFYSFGPGDQVCAYAINQGAGMTNTLLGCRTWPKGPMGLEGVVRRPSA
jgi:hypothetical protein